MKLIMHIGSPKTGSSVIQEALLQHDAMLAASSIKCFSDPRGLSTLYKGFSALPAGRLRREFDSIAAANRWSEGQWQALETFAREDRFDYMLISSEHFMSIRPLDDFLGRLTRLFSGIHVVGYLRDPVSMFVSKLNQQIRGGARFSSLASLWNTPNPMPPVAAMTRYRDAVGAGNLTVRNFDRANLYRNDVVEDFFQVLRGLTGKATVVPGDVVPENQSISGAAAAWLLIQNEVLSQTRAGLTGKEKSTQRHDLIDRIRQCEQAHPLPSLKLADEALIKTIRHHTRQPSVTANRVYLSGQVQLTVGTPMDPLPSLDELQARTRNWVMSYLDKDAARVLSSALLDLE